MGGVLGVQARRTGVTAAIDALRGLRDDLACLPGEDLGPFLAELDALSRAVEAARVAVVTEAVERGETGRGPQGAGASAVRAFVEAWAPSQRHGGGASLLARSVLELRKPDNASLAAAVLAPITGPADSQGVDAAGVDAAGVDAAGVDADGVDADGEASDGDAADGPPELSLRTAAVVLSELDRLRDRVRPETVPTVLDGLITMGASHGPVGVRGLRPRLMAEYGYPGELQEAQHRAKRFVDLSHPVPDDRGPSDVYDYGLRLDPESMALLEAALDALAQPRPTKDEQGNTIPDPRSSGRRRGEALVDLVRRAVAAGDAVGTSPKTQLVVTMDVDDLRARARPGTTLATLAGGTLLGADTVRRLACDAQIIPAVLNGRGEVLDLGRAQRFFTAAQIKALWLRDRICTYPGCSVPASWTDAHHLWHWADGGATDLSNAALLCGRHHTTVHSRLLRGTVVEGRVEWDLTPGSYHELLRQRGLPPPARGHPRARAG